ncbi:MAG: polysaccharide biosynthesis/export family protein [Vicingaceae bacterium]|nr:polysaccharide biosynthesis/export family protein [Vicingaceae bacterium]
MLASLFACNYNSSRMMRTDKGYEFSELPSDTISEYILSKSDILEFQLYTNNGTSIIDITAITETDKRATVLRSGETYLIEPDGFVKLPILERVKLEGMTIRESETLLEKKYAKYYINSFVKLKVKNRRIVVFPGGDGKAQVIPLENENTTMLEALGQVGGLQNTAKAYHIKLIRGDLKDPEVYLFDFSTIEGIQKSDFVLQANDIIYVERRSDAFREFFRDVAPVVSLLASTITLIIVINNLK